MTPEPQDKILQLPQGCGYQGYEFGAGRYPDSMCYGGRLYDCDNCDNDGNLYESAEDIPCPMCREQEAVEYWRDRYSLGGETTEAAEVSASCLIADIRKNRANRTEPWRKP